MICVHLEGRRSATGSMSGRELRDVPPDALLRFWAKVEKTDSCWNWTGSRYHQNGYGTMRIGESNHSAHRISYAIKYGFVPAGRVVMHSCDNPGCVNPDHLSLSDQRQNRIDCISKRRHYDPTGVKNGSAVLTEPDVIKIRELRASGTTNPVIAKMFSVSPTLISAIARGVSWRYVGGPRTHLRGGRPQMRFPTLGEFQAALTKSGKK